MKSSRHDALRLDMAAFAADGAVLSGHWPGHTLARLAELQTPPQDMGPPDVAWQARGERRPAAGEPELWLALTADAPVWLTCQRCLQPMKEPLVLDRRLRFVHGESQAETLDAESDDDVLALGRWLDLRELVEDELLLALPLVPRHAVCPQPLPMEVRLEPESGDGVDDAADADPEPDPADKKPNPFAALLALKTGGGRSGGAAD